MSLKAGADAPYGLRPAAAFSIAACAKKPCACVTVSELLKPCHTLLQVLYHGKLKVQAVTHHAQMS